MDELCGSLERLGAGNVAASRVGEYRRAFNRVRESSRFAVPLEDIPSLLGSMADFHELRRIVFAAEQSSSPSEWSAQIRAIPRGVAFPQEADPRPDGRDTQFECFVAAVVSLGGAAVRFEEPDLLVTHGGETIAIAAKRPRSQKAAVRNVRKAIKQVAESALPGVVVVDFSTALHHGEYVQADGIEDGRAHVRRSTDEAIADIANQVGAVALDSGVMGVLGHVILPMIDRESADGLGIATSVRWTLARLQRQEGEPNPWLDEFEQVCLRGLARPLPGDTEV